MNNKIGQLFEHIKKIRLEQKEREEIRSFLVSKTLNGRHQEQGSNILRAYFINFYRKPMLTLIIALTIAIGGGFSAAAENSLPGDILFPVKIKVNEEVRSAVAITPKAKAKWEIKIVERRLEEAEKLAAKGELKADVSAKIEVNFKAHADKVQKRIAEFKAEDKAELSSNFETSLNAHEAILEKLLNRAVDGKAEIKKIEIKVELEAEKTSKIRRESEIELSEEAEAEVKVETAAQGRLNALENKLDEVEKFIKNMEEKLGAEATAEAKARLEIAKATMAEGKVKFEAGLFGESFKLFQQAHRIAQEAKLLIKAEKELRLNLDAEVKTENKDDKIDLKGSGSLEINL